MLTSKFSVLPTYLGNSLEVVLEGGKQFANIGGQLQEVVYATTSELAKLPYENLAEGFYLVGSGNTGVASALGCMGAIYAGTILSSSLMIRRPAAGYIPAGYVPPEGAAATSGNVDVATVMKTPQFWYLFSTSTLLCTGGMGLISVAKPMMMNVFADAMPLLVTSAFASAYLMAMAAGNLGGRIWLGSYLGQDWEKKHLPLLHPRFHPYLWLPSFSHQRMCDKPIWAPCPHLP